jgi:hypothetical protein
VFGVALVTEGVGVVDAVVVVAVNAVSSALASA